MATSIFINGNEHALSSGLSVSLPTGSIPLKPITQAEYDALSEEEKNSETAWLVTDAEGESSTPSAPNESGSSEEVYSTEETRIGTWIDGKPLYRRVYNVTTPTDSSYNMLVYDSSYDVVRLYGYFTNNSGGGRYMLPSEYCTAISSTPIYWCHLNYKLHYVMFGSTHDDFKGQPGVVILEYTKTTD